MDELLTRIGGDLVGRIDGTMRFRLILQPAVAIFFTIRDGREDARAGRPPYSWAIFTDPSHRDELLREGWKAVSRVFILAVVMDVIYQ